MVEKPDKDEDVKTKAQALFLARGSASHIVHVLTNNKHLVDEAFKFASVKSSSSGDARIIRTRSRRRGRRPRRYRGG